MLPNYHDQYFIMKLVNSELLQHLIFMSDTIQMMYRKKKVHCFQRRATLKHLKTFLLIYQIDVRTEDVEYIFEDLMPGTQYTVEVIAGNKAGVRTDVLPATADFRIPEEDPKGILINLLNT